MESEVDGEMAIELSCGVGGEVENDVDLGCVFGKVM